MDSLKAALSTALAEALNDPPNDPPNDALADSVIDSVTDSLTNSVTENLAGQLTDNPSPDHVDKSADPSQTPLSALQARFMSDHATCAMCDSTLEIHHDVNREALRVKEEAHCPCCGIRVRSSHHLMH